MPADNILEAVSRPVLPLSDTPCVFVDGGKGGVFKTGFWANLAMVMSKAYRVACIGFDVDSDTAPSVFGIEGETMRQITGGPNDRRFSPCIIHTGKKDIIRLASPGLMGEGAGKHARTLDGAGNADLLKNLVKGPVWGANDLVLLDLPAGSSDEWTTAIETFSDILGVVVMVQPSNVEDMERTMERVRLSFLNVLGVVEAFASCAFPDGEAPVHPATGKEFNPWGVNSEVPGECEKQGITYLGALPVLHGLKRVNGRLVYSEPGLVPVRAAAEEIMKLMTEVSE